MLESHIMKKQVYYGLVLCMHGIAEEFLTKERNMTQERKAEKRWIRDLRRYDGPHCRVWTVAID